MQQIYRCSQYEVFQWTPEGFSSNIFVLKSKNDSLIIDVGHQYSPTEPYNTLHQLLTNTSVYGDIKAIVLTHEHIDHLGALMDFPALFQNSSPPILASKLTIAAISSHNSELIDPIGDSSITGNYHWSAKEIGRQLILGSLHLEILSSPGHTPGSICIYEPHHKFLFSGDCVFSEGNFGRTDLPGGDSQQLIQSLEYLSRLECEQLFPGHMESVLVNAKKHIQLAYQNSGYML